MNPYAQRPKETPTMTTPFRDETETLRAQLADAHAEIARMTERLTAPPKKVPMRWTHAAFGDSCNPTWCGISLAFVIVAWIATGGVFIVHGVIDEVPRAVAVVSAAAVAWCLAFVRRVPR